LGVAGIVALAAACTPESPAGVVVPVDVACEGVTGDNASSLGDSRATVELLSALTPGTEIFDVPGTTITATVPGHLAADGTTSSARFDLDWGTVPATAPLPRISSTLLRLAEVGFEQQRFQVSASGAQAASWGTAGPLTVASTVSPLDLPSQTVSGTVGSTTPGLVTYTATSRLAVHLDATVAGVVLGTVVLDCALVGTLPQTGIG